MILARIFLDAHVQMRVSSENSACGRLRHSTHIYMTSKPIHFTAISKHREEVPEPTTHKTE